MSQSNEPNWQDYYEKTETRPPSGLLSEALEHVTHKDKALDLGAGALTDTKHLVEQGFEKVVAVDSSPNVAERAKEIESVEVVTATFDNYAFPEAEFDLVNAQFALPFNPPEAFDDLIRNIHTTLKEEGIFTGQFFGERDSWAGRRQMTFVTEERARELLKDFELIKFEEEEGNQRSTASGNPKHWHIFHFIAKKL